MPDLEDEIIHYYTRGDLMSSILNSLESAKKPLKGLKLSDLAPIDEFHVRGKESTIELATLAQFSDGMQVLDVGCGLGGSARHIAVEHDCMVTGLDLTHEYIDVARQLSDMVGLNSKVRFKQGSGLDLPFQSKSFDIVWTEHTQMNIENKEQFYQEIARVLLPGGRLVFHDIFQGPGGPPHFPVPWAEESSASSLLTPEKSKETIERSQLTVENWVDKSNQSLQWFKKAAARSQKSGPRPLGIHLLLGATAGQKLKNIIRNLKEKRIVIIQGVAGKQ